MLYLHVIPARRLLQKHNDIEIHVTHDKSLEYLRSDIVNPLDANAIVTTQETTIDEAIKITNSFMKDNERIWVCWCNDPKSY